MLSDATKSVSRAYINNFQDKNKQVAIDMFLVSESVKVLQWCQLMVKQGYISTQQQVTIYDPIHDLVREALERRFVTRACI